MEMEANEMSDYKEIGDTLSQVDVLEYVEEKMNCLIFHGVGHGTCFVRIILMLSICIMSQRNLRMALWKLLSL